MWTTYVFGSNKHRFWFSITGLITYICQHDNLRGICRIGWCTPFRWIVLVNFLRICKLICFLCKEHWWDVVWVRFIISQFFQSKEKKSYTYKTGRQKVNKTGSSASYCNMEPKLHTAIKQRWTPVQSSSTSLLTNVCNSDKKQKVPFVCWISLSSYSNSNTELLASKTTGVIF